MTNVLYTIGYASFSLDEIIAVLKKYHISVVADVRSSPYSKFKPEFRKVNLRESLTASGISYMFLGNLLGARVRDPSCYRDGTLDYAQLIESTHFRKGIQCLLDLMPVRGSMNPTPTILCAEKDPVNCHRMFLICRFLRTFPLTMRHILENASCEEHSMTERRLMRLHGLDQPDMFRPAQDLIEEIYDRQCKKITL